MAISPETLRHNVFTAVAAQMGPDGTKAMEEADPTN